MSLFCSSYKAPTRTHLSLSLYGTGRMSVDDAMRRRKQQSPQSGPVLYGLVGMVSGKGLAIRFNYLTQIGELCK